ncbi:MAG: hypothetical protein JXB14_06330 [Candidatus Altiarchaeota archaeon]|nr:hypothetical protein [Candidatus Altiarchaeota archaeon]
MMTANIKKKREDYLRFLQQEQGRKSRDRYVFGEEGIIRYVGDEPHFTQRLRAKGVA